MKTSGNNTDGVHGIKNVLRSLRNRNYRLFFVGQGISLIGTWMQQLAMSWLVYRLTGSAFLLGVVSFSGQIPISIVAPFAGVIADKLNRHKILFVTQTLAMIQALVLAILVMTDRILSWHIIALSIFLGIINGFDMPTRQAFVYEMVDIEEDLPNAIALNSMIFNGARLIGPSVAGLVIELLGESACFFLNAASFLAVLVSLALIRISPKKDFTRHNGPVFTGLKDGLSYAFGSVPIRTILLLLAIVSLFTMPYAVLMPVFAKDILHGGPRTLGFLMGAVGIGAIVGAVFLASRKSIQGIDKIMILAVGILGSSIILFSFSRLLTFSLFMMLLTGVGLMVQMASANTILQSIVDVDKRGRVMSLYTMSFMGMAPFGSLLAGFIASSIGAPHTILISGIFCLFAAAIFSRKLPEIRKTIHPIFVRKGIIPQVASGIGTATQLSAETKE
jgi:MFS family permease